MVPPWKNPYYVQFCKCVDGRYTKYKARGDWRNNLMCVLEYQRKCMIFPKRVHIAKNLYIPPQLKTSYSEILYRIKKGLGVEPFLANDAAKMRWDQEFTESRILHLHFTKIGEVSRKHRGKSTLRLFVPDNSNVVYVLRIETTHVGETWLNMEDEQIIEDNWPDRLPKLNRVTPQKLTASQRAYYGKMHVGTALGVLDKNKKFRALVPNMQNMQGLSPCDMELEQKVIIPFFQFLYNKFQRQDCQIVYTENWFEVVKKESSLLPKSMLRIKWSDFWQSLICNSKKGSNVSVRLTIEATTFNVFDIFLYSNLLVSLRSQNSNAEFFRIKKEKISD